MAKLSTKQRDQLKAEDFAVPDKRKLPIHDRSHVKAAWDFLPRTKGLTDSEIKSARKRILARAKEFGIDTTTWEKQRVSQEAFGEVSLEDLSPRQLRIRSLIFSNESQSTSELTISEEGFREWINLHPNVSVVALLFSPFGIPLIVLYIWQRAEYKKKVYDWAKAHMSQEEADGVYESREGLERVIRKYRKYLMDKKAADK